MGGRFGRIAIACLALGSARAHAEDLEAQASLGVGAVADRVSASFDAAFDLRGESHALGLGARVRTAGDRVRTEDWDEPSEWARVIRYALYRGDEVSLAMGELAGTTLGSGRLVDGYASGLHIDHGHVGFDGQWLGERGYAHAMVDDVVAPRIAAARGSHRLLEGLDLGLEIAGDRQAPAMDGARVVGLFGVDARYHRDTPTRAMGASAHLGGAPGLGAGIGLGVDGAARLGRAIVLEATAGVDASTSGYAHGWIGPLYEIERVGLQPMDSLVDRAERGQLGSVGAHLGLSLVSDRGWGVGARYQRRPGRGDLIVARAGVPHLDPVQVGAWAAVAAGDDGDVLPAALAAEARIRLPHRMLVGAELSRLVRSSADGTLMPTWTAMASVGAVLGESR